jgi:hypothetical protein
LAAVFGVALSGCDFIDGLLGKGGDSGNDNTGGPEPLAKGGQIAIQDDWEIHTFTESASLEFFTSPGDSIMADYLIVGGGGGAGGDRDNMNGTDHSGGGGAGGLLYQTGQTLPLSGGAVQITVGAGGTGGAILAQGENGGVSAIGNIEVPGGGGGGAPYAGTPAGKDGGSGGGAGAGNNSASGTVGQSVKSGEIQGNNGGLSVSDRGGGGGGAASEGKNASADGGGAGGDPWVATTAAPWIVDVTKIHEFSRGGTGGFPLASDDRNGVNYGDGGSAGNNSQKAGGNGHDGIVVIRFQRPSGI